MKMTQRTHYVGGKKSSAQTQVVEGHLEGVGLVVALLLIKGVELAGGMLRTEGLGQAGVQGNDFDLQVPKMA